MSNKGDLMSWQYFFPEREEWVTQSYQQYVCVVGRRMVPQGSPPLDSKNPRMCAFLWKGSPADVIMFRILSWGVSRCTLCNHKGPNKKKKRRKNTGGLESTGQSEEDRGTDHDFKNVASADKRHSKEVKCLLHPDTLKGSQ